MELNFTKMQALGNDFILIDDRDSSIRKLHSLSKKLCDRRFGIGADQLLLLCHSTKADYGMRIFNADGSEVEMCGNGIRCLGKFILDDVLRCEESAYAKRYCQTIDSISVETVSGIRQVYPSGNLFKIDMGEPVFSPRDIPVKPAAVRKSMKNGAVVNHPLKAGKKSYRATLVSLGNPHAVIFVSKADSVDLETIGPLVERNAIFPNRTNVEFVQVQDRNTLIVRVWERGSGQTLACGTGASASAVAAALLGLTERKVNVNLPGGKLKIHWSQRDNHVYMTGPAQRVYDGTIDV